MISHLSHLVTILHLEVFKIAKSNFSSLVLSFLSSMEYFLHIISLPRKLDNIWGKKKKKGNGSALFYRESLVNREMLE